MQALQSIFGTIKREQQVDFPSLAYDQKDNNGNGATDTHQKVHIARSFLERFVDDRSCEFRFRKVTSSLDELIPAVKGHGVGRRPSKVLQSQTPVFSVSNE